MLKSIQFKLSKIKYGGDSIGDDIRLEIEILNQSLRVDKTIKVGAVAEINREVGKIETDQKLFTAGLRITVIETTRWTEIYNALIKARKNDFMSVGALEVID